MQQIQLKVHGMRCANCIRFISDGLKELGGVGEVSVALEQKEVLVEYDPEKVLPEQLQRTIEAIGHYQVTL